MLYLLLAAAIAFGDVPHMQITWRPMATRIAVDPVGEYGFETEMGGQPVHGGFRITKADTGYAAAAWADGNATELVATSTRLDGNTFTMVIPVPEGSVQIKLVYAGDGSISANAVWLDGPMAGSGGPLTVARKKK